MSPGDRLDERARAWRVAIDDTRETATSVIGFGRREDQAVVLKVFKRPGDEWTSGRVLHAFQGRGVVTVHEFIDGAVLLERLTPGHSLVSMALDGRDDDATDILSDVMRQMSGHEPPPDCAAVHDWAGGFERYRRSGDLRIPLSLVQEAHRWWLDLCSSQRTSALLHGDLHHDNVLFDSHRGWVAIDPKGVVGEPEYELGAMLRNPIEEPDLFLPPATIERRLTRVTSRLNLDSERALAWGFAQAVLSAIWDIEDGVAVDAANPCIRLAHTMRAMLPPRVVA